MEMDVRTRREVACQILGYLRKHPAAKDTLEGIAGWWLERQRVERTVDEVAESLRLLVGRGLIMGRREGAGRLWYQVNPAKWIEIEGFLGGMDDTVPLACVTPARTQKP